MASLKPIECPYESCSALFYATFSVGPHNDGDSTINLAVSYPGIVRHMINHLGEPDD